MIGEEHQEPEAGRDLHVAVEGRVDEIPEVGGDPGEARDAAVQDVGDAAKGDGPAAGLELSVRDEEAGSYSQGQSGVVIEVGGQAEPDR